MKFSKELGVTAPHAGAGVLYLAASMYALMCEVYIRMTGSSESSRRSNLQILSTIVPVRKTNQSRIDRPCHTISSSSQQVKHTSRNPPQHTASYNMANALSLSTAGSRLSTPNPPPKNSATAKEKNKKPSSPSFSAIFQRRKKQNENNTSATRASSMTSTSTESPLLLGTS